MTARNALCIVNNTIVEIPAGDALQILTGGTGATTAAGALAALGAQAALGYAPARPVTGFSTSASNVGIPGNNAAGVVASVRFVATATTVLAVSSVTISNTSGTATAAYGYLRLLDVTAGTTAASGTQVGCAVAASSQTAGSLGLVLEATGLTIGDTYEVDVMASTTGTVGTTAVYIAIGGSNL